MAAEEGDLRELFKALELAHYAARYRDKIFVVALGGDTDFADLLLDFKVLLGYRIQLVLVLADPQLVLQDIIAQSNRRGTRFNLSLLTDMLMPGGVSTAGIDYGRLLAALKRGDTPIIALQVGSREQPNDKATFDLGAQVAARLQAGKLFLLAHWLRPIIEAMPRSHMTLHDLAQHAATFPDAAGSVLDFVATRIEAGLQDIVLLDGAPARLFREVFTYDGAGALFNRTRATHIRQAHVRDITDIALLLRPEVDAGRILPIGENQIENDIRYYYVYEIDGVLVGLARLKLYGDMVEVAQFATLQRYRGKGRARELANHLVDVAREGQIKAVFALSVDPRMWEFFHDLGFAPVAREALPEPWRRQYDMARPSRAFIKQLT